MIRVMSRLWMLFLLPLVLSAELPDFYQRVERVAWVVADLDTVVAGWQRAGMAGIIERGEVDLSGVRVKTASANAGGVWIDWIQPLDKKNPYADFLARSGDGVFALLHRVASPEVLRGEEERLRGLGVGVLLHGSMSGGAIEFVLFDTYAQGKYVLGLIYDERPPEGASGGGLNISQYAFAVREFAPVSAYWAKLGFPAMKITTSGPKQASYKGRTVSYRQQQLGWQRHGKVPYEWCVPLDGPNTYDDHIRVRGEGFHHFGVPVDDMDEAVAHWKDLGYSVSQSGGWGEPGKPGSGRYAYIDTESLGGVSVELLWNLRSVK